MRTKVALVVLAAITVVVVGSGCATIVSGSRQQVKIESDPPGAIARVEEQTISTPGSITLKRNRTYTVYISKEGYEEKKVYLNCEMNPWLWGNLGFGGLIGIVVDSSTGAANKLTPESINVVLNKLPQEATASIPNTPHPAGTGVQEQGQHNSIPSSTEKTNP
jgi:hypothetical protein